MLFDSKVHSLFERKLMQKEELQKLLAVEKEHIKMYTLKYYCLELISLNQKAQFDPISLQ
jgi:hypothetical protein